MTSEAPPWSAPSRWKGAFQPPRLHLSYVAAGEVADLRGPAAGGSSPLVFFSGPTPGGGKLRPPAQPWPGDAGGPAEVSRSSGSPSRTRGWLRARPRRATASPPQGGRGGRGVSGGTTPGGAPRPRGGPARPWRFPEDGLDLETKKGKEGVAEAPDPERRSAAALRLWREQERKRGRGEMSRRCTGERRIQQRR